jgi:lipoprotein-anchoring transpeptidase ErfK/SrfK
MVALLAACGGKDDAKAGDAAPAASAGAQANNPNAVAVAWDPREQDLTPEQIAAQRMDMSWQQVVQMDSMAPGRPVKNPERWNQITAQAVNNSPMHLPLTGDVEGPSVLRVQILLDRALFSPGMMDGRWGKNAAEALYWFQKMNGLRATAVVDSPTVAKLSQLAGSPRELIVRRTLTANDVAGPFTVIPKDVYEQAKLDCSCYQTLTEKLSEKFHITQDLLKQLNPGVDLDHVAAGTAINAPAVDGDRKSKGTVASIEVSGRGTYVHALDASGRVLYHFPSTLGATYSPSPSGKFAVSTVTQDPAWHYQPALLTGVDDSLPEAMVPKGPNNAVGVVWMALSEPHYGIHGTGSPETIGYATSHGCVRLTNWDAEFLSHQVRRGIPVHFRDIAGAGNGTAPSDVGRGEANAAVNASASKAGGTAAPARSGASGGRTGGTSGRTGARADSANRTAKPRTRPRAADTTATTDSTTQR